MFGLNYVSLYIGYASIKVGVSNNVIKNNNMSIYSEKMYIQSLIEKGKLAKAQKLIDAYELSRHEAAIVINKFMQTGNGKIITL
jgi:hypothetical protein